MVSSPIILSLLVILLATSCQSFHIDRDLVRMHKAKRATTGTHFLFAFGDSYTRVKFSTKKSAPSGENCIGNPLFPGLTTSGGTNWPVMLGSQYNTSTTLIWDYAYGGATINKSIISPPNNGPIHDLNDQVNLFKLNMTGDDAPRWWQPHRSLFAVWFGQNDVYQSFLRSYSDPAWRFNAALDRYFDRMDDLYELGARDFLWIGAAPITRTPLVLSLSQDDQTKIADLLQSFNSRLSARATAFADSHDGLTWRYYDPAPAFDRVLDDPTKYGYSQSNDTCSDSDGTTCPWWNHFHPAVSIHEQIAADIAGNETYSVLFKPSL